MGYNGWRSKTKLLLESFLTARRHFRILGLLLCSALLTLPLSCASDVQNQKPAVKSPVEAVPQDHYPDDVGRFLAGLPVRAESPIAKLEDSPAWAQHRKDLDTAWSKVLNERLPVMRTFQKDELASQRTVGSTVFYPFSGPDTLTVTVFFPQSPLYVMVGLEPAGTLPSPQQLQQKDLTNYLAETRDTVASELQRSFFITHQMDTQFRGQITDGLCLPILELLVRSNHTIFGFRYVRLDDHGQIVERPANYRGTGKNWNKGVEIEFRTDDDQSMHKLYYFSVNLADDHLKENPAFMTYLASLQGAATFLKATSYMLHQPGFSMIRDHVLSESAAVLQDDSGVPYHYYLTPSWRVVLYGDYTQPYGSFRYLVQKDLRNAYQTQKPRPLPFRIGYGFRAVPSNLLYATRMN